MAKSEAEAKRTGANTHTVNARDVSQILARKSAVADDLRRTPQPCIFPPSLSLWGPSHSQPIGAKGVCEGTLNVGCVWRHSPPDDISGAYSLWQLWLTAWRLFAFPSLPISLILSPIGLQCSFKSSVVSLYSSLYALSSPPSQNVPFFCHFLSVFSCSFYFFSWFFSLSTPLFFSGVDVDLH